jgi:hypothetical protein
MTLRKIKLSRLILRTTTFGRLTLGPMTNNRSKCSRMTQSRIMFNGIDDNDPVTLCRLTFTEKHSSK